MKFIRLAAASVAIAALAGCSTHSGSRDAGPVSDRSFTVGAFQRIEVTGAYDVVVHAAGAPGVTARGGSSILDDLAVSVDNGTLRIRSKEKRHGWLWHGHDKVEISVSGGGAIDGASVLGSSDVKVDSVTAPSFKGEIAGSGDLAVASLKADTVDLSIAGSGTIHAAGAAKSVAMDIAGSGDIDAPGLTATDAKVTVAGSGNVGAKATGSAAITILGSGDVTVTGGGKCTVSKHGSGDAHCS